jgi:sugar/nucleoside kinase (ribokinase family)
VKPVAVIGHLAWDVVDGAEPRVGGGPWYGGRALRHLDVRAHVGVKLGESDRTALLHALASNGLPVIATCAGETTSFAIDHDGDERTMTVQAIGEPWRPDELARAAGEAHWVHIAPLLRSDVPTESLAALGERRVLLDGQGLVRVPQLGPLVLDADFDRDLLRHVAVLKLAEEEALALAGSTDADALRELGVPEVVVTLGARGSLVLAHGEVTRVPARPLEIEVDTTGAGDAFAAGYVAARAEGHSPVSAARRATSVAAAVLV